MRSRSEQRRAGAAWRTGFSIDMLDVWPGNSRLLMIEPLLSGETFGSAAPRTTQLLSMRDRGADNLAPRIGSRTVVTASARHASVRAAGSVPIAVLARVLVAPADRVPRR